MSAQTWFFDELGTCIDAATARDGVVRDLVIAGLHVRVTVAGDRLADLLLPGLGSGRAADPADSPDLTFDVADATTTGPAPRPPWTTEDYLARDEVRTSGDGGIDAACSVDPLVVTLFDRGSRRGLWWAQDPSRLPVWEPGAPLRNLLHWGLASRGLQLAHGAVVGTDDGGLLLAGRGGIGKSTTALACLADGWSYVSDDYCALSPDGVAHTVFGSGKLDAHALAALPELAHLRRDVEAPKNILGLSDNVVESLPLRFIAVPELGPGPTRVEPARAVDAGRALTPSTVLQLPGGEGIERRLAVAISGLPVVRLILGPDVRSAPPVLAGVLQELHR